ncbi:MAG: hypothetical protein JWO69_474, partial [Thermoleophilia bacterium]|nr:hypothetical protein [Thermoleophilia bacterium]
MDLRLLMFAARVLDPRRWRARLLQLTGAVAALAYVWVRAVRAV